MHLLLKSILSVPVFKYFRVINKDNNAFFFLPGQPSHI